jgi:hypothetical protein
MRSKAWNKRHFRRLIRRGAKAGVSGSVLRKNLKDWMWGSGLLSGTWKHDPELLQNKEQ